MVRLRPSYLVHWQISAFEVNRFLGSGNPLIRRLRHFGSSHPETLRDRLFVAGIFVVVAIIVSRRATHHKLTRWYPDIDLAVSWVLKSRLDGWIGLKREQAAGHCEQYGNRQHGSTREFEFLLHENGAPR
jgi:hypothetical protein